MALTDAKVRAARPGTTLTDDDGSRGRGRLLLVVSAHGRKSWTYRQRRGSADTTKKVGEYPAMTLAEARKESAQLGDHPEPLRRAGSFGKLLDEYVQSLKARAAASAADTEAELERSIPLDDPIRSREARRVTTSDIAAILRRKSSGKASGNPKPGAAPPTTRVNRLRSMLSAAFNHASRHDYDPRKPHTAATFLIQHNPVLATPRIAEWEKARDRVLTHQEARAFWKRMGELNGTEQQKAIGAFWQCVMLTGQRATQLLKAQREGDLLVLTDTKGKNAKPKRHALPMTPRIAKLWPATEAARRGGPRGVHIDTIRQSAAAALPEGVVASDIRRTVETLLKDAGVSRDDRAELLSHGRTGVQAAHYERTDSIEPKLRALRLVEAWVLR